MAIDDLPLREELRGKSPYGAPQVPARVRLNTNENPYPPSPALVADLSRRVSEAAVSLNRYPDRGAVALREALAAYVGRVTGVDVTPGQVWAANGSNEVLQQLLQCFGGPGRRALGFSPSYSMHPILAAGTQTEFVDVPRGEGFAITGAVEAVREYKPDIVFVTTPNNPSGTVTPLAVIREILEETSGIVIVDEAYMEFSQAPSAVTLLEEYPTHLVVSRTMSKAFDFAGARVGYFVAHPDFVDAVSLVRLPYHLSTLTQEAALAALDHADETLDTVRRIVEGREYLARELAAAGHDPVASEANFLLFAVEGPESWQALLDLGVLVRDVGIPGYLRVTVGTPEENEAFLKAVRSAL